MSVIVSGRVLHANKHVVIALTYIYGVGKTTAQDICREAKVKEETKVQDLSEIELEAIRSQVSRYEVEGDLRRTVSLHIKSLMDKGCYRGRRLRAGLPVRGQKTKTNAKTAKKRKRRSSGSKQSEGG